MGVYAVRTATRSCLWACLRPSQSRLWQYPPLVNGLERESYLKHKWKYWKSESSKIWECWSPKSGEGRCDRHWLGVFLFSLLHATFQNFGRTSLGGFTETFLPDCGSKSMGWCSIVMFSATLQMTGIGTLCQRQLTNRSLHAKLTRVNGASEESVRHWGNTHCRSTSFVSACLQLGERAIECPEGCW